MVESNSSLEALQFIACIIAVYIQGRTYKDLLLFIDIRKLTIQYAKELATLYSEYNMNVPEFDIEEFILFSVREEYTFIENKINPLFLGNISEKYYYNLTRKTFFKELNRIEKRKTKENN